MGDDVIAEIDRIARESLTDFVGHVFAEEWFGREREAVSLYTLGYLLPHCRPDGFLRHPTQIGIEGAVPQIDGPNRKKLPPGF